MILEFRSDLTETFFSTCPVARTVVERAVLRHLETFRDQDAMTGPVVEGVRTLITLVSLPGYVKVRVWWFETRSGFGILHLGLRESEDEDAWEDDL